MPFSDFLKLCQTIRAIYDKNKAQQFFEKNVSQFYNLGDFTKKSSLPNLDFELS